MPNLRSRIFFVSCIAMLTVFSSHKTLAQKRTTITGTVVNAKTKKPLPHSHIYIEGTTIGTVTNYDGAFLIKVPKKLADSRIIVSNMGFATKELSIQEQLQTSGDIMLTPIAVVMDEFVTVDPITVLQTCFARVPANYGKEHKEITTFYRETIKKNKLYVDVSQGILNVLKVPYNTEKRDQISVYKGYRSKNYDNKDTLTLRLQGGPTNLLLIDVAKHPKLLFGEDFRDLYDLTYEGLEKMSGFDHYRISFNRKPNTSGFYKGVIFIEKNSLAITKASFEFNEFGLDISKKELVKKKPVNAKVTPKAFTYEVTYKELDGKWYLHFSRSEIVMKVNWDKKLFNSTFYATSEMVVTESLESDGSNFKPTNKLSSRELFSEKAESYYDKEFWEDYSIIKPEDDLIKALVKNSGG